MRRFLTFLVVLALLAGAYLVADHWAKDSTQTRLGHDIEEKFPGAQATVRIDSFPYTWYLGVSGEVKEMTAQVTDLQAEGVEFSSVNLRVHDLKVSRNALFDGNVRLQSIGSGYAVGVIPQASIDERLHAPLVLSPGRIGLAGTPFGVHLTLSGGALRLDLGHGVSASIAIPLSSALPCATTATVVSGAVQVSCSFTSIPAELRDTTYHF